MGVILTEKQLQAQENLEKALKMTHRSGFMSYDDFSEYMKHLIKKMGKKVRLQKAVSEGITSYEEVNKRSKEKKILYYNDFDVLKNYGIKYIQKYYPSYNKLTNKLIEKCKNEELANEVVNYLLEKQIQYSDKILIQNYFNNYLLIGKNYNKIKLLLLKKGFNKKDVDEKINQSKEITNASVLDPFVLKRKIETLLKKGKSEYYIISKLSDTKFDTELIKEILEELNFDNNDIIEKELIKLKNKGLEKQKIIQKMYSKGYSYDDIKYKI